MGNDHRQGVGTVCCHFAVAKRNRECFEDAAGGLEQEDLDGFMKGYWNSPELTFAGSNGFVRGWEPVAARYERDYPNQAHRGDGVRDVTYACEQAHSAQ